MCGICGIFDTDNIVNSKDNISLINSYLSHRGKDGKGIYINNNIALGHTRLSIIDLSFAAKQPMISNDKRYVLVFNGEIYNFNELKSQIKEYNFKSNTDSEVVLAAYIKWGKDCLTNLNGMFAFAIWDNLKKHLFIARDRLGIKPLYIYYNKSKFIFASEIRALINSKLLNIELDFNSLTNYLSYQTVYAPNSFVKDIRILMPGHYIELNKNEYKIKKYWNISDKNYNQTENSYFETKNKVKNLLENAVKERLISDVPIGAFLSGGIDSSIIVALMSRFSEQRVKTFTITFDENKYNESKYADIIAKKYKTEHNEIKLKPDDLLNQIPIALNSMDFPSGDGINTYIISKFVKDAGLSVVLSGLGADELFAGYDIFKRAVLLNKYANFLKIPLSLRKLIGKTIKKVKPSIASNKISKIISLKSWNNLDYYPISREVIEQNHLKKILANDYSNKNNLNHIIEKLNDDKHFRQLPIISKISISEIVTYLQNILLRDTDQMSMANTLELRVPFLDHNLVEYVLSLPDKYKYPHTPKKLLVDSFENLLPNEIIYRKKMGFVFPWEYWLKNELFEFSNTSIKNLSEREYFNKNEIINLWKKFLKNDRYITWSRIWHLIVLENWLNKNEI